MTEVSRQGLPSFQSLHAFKEKAKFVTPMTLAKAREYLEEADTTLTSREFLSLNTKQKARKSVELHTKLHKVKNMMDNDPREFDSAFRTRFEQVAKLLLKKGFNID